MTPAVESVAMADGARLILHRRGAGRRVVFQHGLGGDHAQTFDTFPDMAGLDLHTLDCRAHGASPSQGPLSIAQFAQDVDTVVAPGAVLGGISMGAAIAMRLAVARRDLAALVLVRPAWTTHAAPANMAPVAEVARLIAQGRGAEAFAATETHARLLRDAPDNVASLMGYFTHPDPQTTARLLSAIAADGPGVTEADLAALDVPMLVIGCAEDAIHPLDHARTLAALIPRARLAVVPPKGRDRAAHRAAVHAAIADFLAGALT